MFIWQTEPTWFNPSAHIERMTHRSSACSAMCGCQSDTHVPDWPYCAELALVGRIVLSLVPIAVMTRRTTAGIGLPASLSSAGLGSYRSRWLGPPSMNRKMTRFAFGAKCEGRGASGLSGDGRGAPRR